MGPTNDGGPTNEAEANIRVEHPQLAQFTWAGGFQDVFGLDVGLPLEEAVLGPKGGIP